MLPACVLSAVEKDTSISLSSVWPLVTPTVNIISPSSSLAKYGAPMKPTVTTACVCTHFSFVYYIRHCM